MQNDHRKALRLSELVFSPHLLVFWFYNVLYFLPLLAISQLGENQGLTSRAFDMPVVLAAGYVYAQGLIAFSTGSIVVLFVQIFRSRGLPARSNRYAEFGTSEKIAVLALILVYIGSKIALIPLGVYQEYAFDTGSMTGGVWSFSTVCSECMLLASILVLSSKSRHNVLGFFLISLLNAINLLHGSRLVFVVNVMAAIVLLYLRGVITLRRILLYGPIIFVPVLLLIYFVFLSRSGSLGDGSFSLVTVLSPIVLESVLSQLSLQNVLNSPSLMNSTGSIANFFGDVIINAAPRFILPDKDSQLFFSSFDFLSPEGAFNGYASSIIYFGVFWPAFYFILGIACSYAYWKARTSYWWTILYVYFSADILFRFMRDGSLIPIKMLINAIEFLSILIVLRAIFRHLKRNRAGGPSRTISEIYDGSG
jgi:oligosaccharide repeat unit polymerase